MSPMLLTLAGRMYVFLKSAGTSCTIPLEIFFCDIYKLAFRKPSSARIQPAFAKFGVVGVGWHTFRHTVGTLLADMGEHQLTIRDYLRHSNLSVTNKYLQATSKTKRLAQEKLVDAILPTGSLSASKSNLIQ